MAKTKVSLAILFLFLMLLSLDLVEFKFNVMLMVFQGKWCVAKPMTSDDMLQANIDFACNHVDCGLIRYGGGCYYLDTLINHASVIMNLYYQAKWKKRYELLFQEHWLHCHERPK
ncbi:hypothetical protein ACB094_09G112900 [Castanea mollissima]